MGIIYTTKSWNPETGCSPVSPGCAHCWAKRQGARHHQAWGSIICHDERLELPLHWRQPQMIAVSFMGDLFHPDVPDAFLEQVFLTMFDAHWHTFLLLTKRPERLAEWRKWVHPYIGVEDGGHIAEPRWPANVWLGVSVENQHFAEVRLPLLAPIPAAKLWLSAEPLLGPLNLRTISIAGSGGATYDALRGTRTTVFELGGSTGAAGLGRLSLIVVGGESGPGARHFNPDWARDIRQQTWPSSEIGCAFYMKQMGTAYVCERRRIWREAGRKGRPTGDLKGEDWDCWRDCDDDLRIRQWPTGEAAAPFSRPPVDHL